MMMSKRNVYRDHMDPEYQRWGRKYPRFPGIAECARLIRAGKAKGAWADIIAQELAEHAAACLAELIQTYRTDPSDGVRLYMMMALEIAQLPESVPFLIEVLHDGNPMFTRYAERALQSINTPEARTALWNATHDDRGTTGKKQRK
jgi:hypothetical protein